MLNNFVDVAFDGEEVGLYALELLLDLHLLLLLLDLKLDCPVLITVHKHLKVVLVDQLSHKPAKDLIRHCLCILRHLRWQGCGELRSLLVLWACRRLLQLLEHSVPFVLYFLQNFLEHLPVFARGRRL